ncbi:outer membrane beta-barrel protein [Pseudoalteromonas sp. SYSU M81236]|uniref:outer membrane beta-barrel protein n=1 Tax=Pseudoalteromonas sp. SYSU M81236 TaxID=3447014 RepID=UPI003F06E430
MYKLLTVAMCSMPFFAHSALNENKFGYIGISAQKNYYDVNFIPLIEQQEILPLRYDYSDTGTGFRGFAGYQFNQYLAIEAGFSVLGEAEFNVYSETTNQSGTVVKNSVYSGGLETNALDLRLLGTYPITGNVFVRAHLGSVLWDSNFSFLQKFSDDYFIVDQKDSGVSLLTGLGIGYALSSGTALTLDYENTKINDSNTHNIVASIVFKI